MDFKYLLFSAQGRINRQPYIITVLIIVIVSGVIQGIVNAAGVSPDVALIVNLILTVITLYFDVMLGIKRAHDRDRSGWFVIVMFIPILNLWPLVEFIFLKGTEGQNRFGPDPLSAPQPAA